MYIYIICRTNCRTSGQCLFIRPVKKHGSVSRSRYSRILETFARETETVSAETAFQPSRGIRFLARVLRRGGEELERFFSFLPLERTGWRAAAHGATHESRIAAALEGCKASEIFSSSLRASISSPSAYLKTRSTLQPRCPGARGT